MEDEDDFTNSPNKTATFSNNNGTYSASSPITKKDVKPEALIFQAIDLIQDFLHSATTDSVFDGHLFWTQYVYPTVRAYRAIENPSHSLIKSMRKMLLACSEYISRQPKNANNANHANNERYVLDLDRYLLDFFPDQEGYKRLESNVRINNNGQMQQYYRALYSFAKTNEMAFDAVYYYALIVNDGDRIRAKFPQLDAILEKYPDPIKQRTLEGILETKSHEEKIKELKERIAASPEKTRSPKLSNECLDKPLVVLDTNVLLSDSSGYLGAFLDFVDLLIPMPVIEELFDLKGNPHKAPMASRALSFLEAHQSEVCKVDRLGDVSDLHLKEPTHSLKLFGKMDDQIIESCVGLKRKSKGIRVVFLTDDLNASLKAKAEGVVTMSFSEFTKHFYIQ